MTGKEHGNGWLWPLQDRPYITLHHGLINCDDSLSGLQNYDLVNLKNTGQWKTEISMNTQIIALTTQISELETKVDAG